MGNSLYRVHKRTIHEPADLESNSVGDPAFMLNVLKKASRQFFFPGDRLGVHVLPKHYYREGELLRFLMQILLSAILGRVRRSCREHDEDPQVGWKRETGEANQGTHRPAAL